MSNIDWASCPEATHFDPVDQNFLREIDRALLLFNRNNGWYVPVHTQYGTTIEDCNRPLLKRPEWTGEGLPPVGTVCELRPNKLTDWSAAKIEFAYRNVIVWDWIGEPSMNGLCTAYSHNVEFRPIRTAEQIAAEEREQAASDLFSSLCPDGKWHKFPEEGKAVYRSAIAAGWRKQVQP